MANIEDLYTGDGTTVLFSFTFPYISRNDVKVSVEGALTTDFTFANASTIEFNTAPGNGESIRIFRETEIAQPRAVFSPGSPIRSNDLNQNNEQLLFSAQESNKTASEAGALVESVVNTANQASLDASTALNAATIALSSVSAVVAFAPVADITALGTLSPANGEFFELLDSSGAETSALIAGVPAGLIGDDGLIFRLRYDDPPGEFTFLGYLAADPENRYGVPIADLQQASVSLGLVVALS